MKKTMRLMGLWALMMLAIVSCKKENKTVTFEAKMPETTTMDKTHLGDDNYLVWNSGDQIKVYTEELTDGTAAVFSTTSNNSRTATFSGTLAESSSYIAFYPSEGVTRSGNNILYPMPANQNYVDGDFAFNTYPMYATSTGTTFNFTSLCGLLKLSFTGTGTIGSVVLSDNYYECIAGQFEYNVNTGSYGTFFTEPAITMDCGAQGLTLSDAPVTMYFVVPSGYFTHGFTAVLKNLQDEEMYTLSTSQNNEITAQVIREMPTLNIAAVSVTTGTATPDAETPSTVTLNGSYSAPTGMSVSEVGFYWGQGADLTEHQTATLSTNFSLVIEDLTEGTEYSYYAYAKNGNNMIVGETLTFTTGTSIVAPTVMTAAITNITSTTAIGGGTITSTGGGIVSECGVCWSTSSNPTIADHHALGQLNEDSFAVNMTGLSDGVRYYVRAFATNEAGTTYGAQKTFKTLEGGSHGWVDLGLPSGTLWATCNIGANSPEKAGSYLIYNQARTYNLPSLTQWTELRNNTESTWGTLNGVNGYYFTSANGNSIFLPAAGYSYVTGYSSQTTISDNGSQGYYWSNSVVTGGVSMFSFKSSGFVGGTADYSMGLSVRTVHAAF